MRIFFNPPRVLGAICLPQVIHHRNAGLHQIEHPSNLRDSCAVFRDDTFSVFGEDDDRQERELHGPLVEVRRKLGKGG